MSGVSTSDYRLSGVRNGGYSRLTAVPEIGEWPGFCACIGSVGSAPVAEKRLISKVVDSRNHVFDRSSSLMALPIEP